jgi:hypothetical protein
MVGWPGIALGFIRAAKGAGARQKKRSYRVQRRLSLPSNGEDRPRQQDGRAVEGVHDAVALLYLFRLEQIRVVARRFIRYASLSWSCIDSASIIRVASMPGLDDIIDQEVMTESFYDGPIRRRQ